MTWPAWRCESVQVWPHQQTHPYAGVRDGARHCYLLRGRTLRRAWLTRTQCACRTCGGCPQQSPRLTRATRIQRWAGRQRAKTRYGEAVKVGSVAGMDPHRISAMAFWEHARLIRGETVARPGGSRENNAESRASCDPSFTRRYGPRRRKESGVSPIGCPVLRLAGGAVRHGSGCRSDYGDDLPSAMRDIATRSRARLPRAICVN